jgi:hypothetical protein
MMRIMVSGVVFAAFALSSGAVLAQSATSVATGAASSQSGSVAGNVGDYQALSVTETSPANQTIKNVPNVYAPGLTAGGSEVCLGSMSAGGAGAGFGVTIGGTYVDKECQLRLNARTLAVLGYPVAARETMCLDPDVREAMLAAGTPCRADVAYARGGRPLALKSSSTQPLPLVAQEELASASDEQPRCRKEYQLIGGWYDVCK